VHAADIVPRYYAAPPQPYPLAWAGPYVGATLGYEWGSIDNNPTRPSGVAGGSEAGFNWQTGNFVYGGETDFNLSAADDTFAPWKFSNPWFGTVRARRLCHGQRPHIRQCRIGLRRIGRQYVLRSVGEP
jgi:outer membrane immunogenic protein